ncbi:MAG: AAA family ATPase [Candidatus Thermoplasmatota archaeon]|nr:AAA family ATPase [Candidatus Thermoplasmatota archaeon]
MDYERFVDELKNPNTFGLKKETPLTMLQTHISLIVLTGTFAYKIKKPVNFGFLDFSTLEKRKKYCFEERRLNSYLCPDLYEEVVVFTETSNGNKLEINGDGPIVDFAVKMKQFPQEHMMTNLLKNQMITTDHIDELIDQLVPFYKKSKSTEEIKSYGTVDAIKKNIDENFEQTKNKINQTISLEQYQHIKKANESFFSLAKSLFEHRRTKGFIKSCHGDLHSGNIVLFNDNLCIFDCIEFNKRFRYIDVASDIGFLAMDLDIQNHPFLSSYLIKEYTTKSNDHSLVNVLNFYKSYRAYVRGKVLGFQLDDPHIDNETKKSLLHQISTYFSLSSYYAELMTLQVRKHKPLLFMMSGLTGTGKSTVALKLSIDYNAIVINTDVVRKKRVGIDTYERHLDDPNTGLYSPNQVHQTYKKVISKAEDLLSKGRNVILDATFQKQRYRQMVQTLSKQSKAIFIPVLCTCQETTAKEWLDNRLKTKSVSDGRWEIYQMQKKSFEAFTDDEKPITIHTDNTDYDKRMTFFNSMLNRIKQEYV